MPRKRKTEKTPRQKAIEKLDDIFSKYIRLRDCDSEGIVVCPLCGAKKYRKESQNMHFISRGVLKYRFDEDNCHAGCMRCNVILNGNYMRYTRRMIEKYGIKKVDEMMNDKSVYSIKTYELEEMIDNYEKLAKAIASRKHLDV